MKLKSHLRSIVTAVTIVLIAVSAVGITSIARSQCNVIAGCAVEVTVVNADGSPAKDKEGKIIKEMKDCIKEHDGVGAAACSGVFSVDGSCGTYEIFECSTKRAGAVCPIVAKLPPSGSRGKLFSRVSSIIAILTW